MTISTPRKVTHDLSFAVHTLKQQNAFTHREQVVMTI